jgi:hypothetical protein
MDYHVVRVIVDLLTHGHDLALYKAPDNVDHHPILLRQEDIKILHVRPLS